jgi:hypothetical protein
VVKNQKKKITKTKDFTEINKLLANGYKHFQNEETDMLIIISTTKCRRNKKKDTSRLIP